MKGSGDKKMKKELKNPGVIEFSATVIDAGGGGAYVEFPFDTESLFGTKGRIPVRVLFDAAPYQGTMLRYGTEKHIIILVKKIQKVIKKKAGNIVNVKVELDDQLRVVTIPEDVQLIFEKNQWASEKFKNLSYTHQKEYIDWILDAKRDVTRLKRIDQMIQKLIDQN